MKQNGYMAGVCSELASDILARNIVDQAQLNNRALHLVQRSHTAKHHGMLLGRGNDVVGGGGIGNQPFYRRAIDDMGTGVIVATSTIARDISRQNHQHPGRIVRQSHQLARLRQGEETQERLLHAIERIISAQTFPTDDAGKARSMLMHQDGDPALKAVRATCFLETA
jgi:hypothetical protein